MHLIRKIKTLIAAIWCGFLLVSVAHGASAGSDAGQSEVVLKVENMT